MASKLRIDGDCSICQYPKHTNLAAISCCKHTFHLGCIKSWSQITNKCPFCKLRFKYITSLQTRNLISVENREQKLDRDDLNHDFIENDLYWNAQACEICRSTDASTDEYAIICDGCDKIYHTFCIGLGHNVPSQNHWFCASCTKQLNLTLPNPTTITPSENSAVYKDDMPDFDENEELPDDVFSKKKYNSEDDEWLPSGIKSKNIGQDFGVINRKRNKCKKRKRKGQMDLMNDVKRRKVMMDINCDVIDNDLKTEYKNQCVKHDDILDGRYYEYGNKKDGVSVVNDRHGEQMWQFTFKKRRKKKTTQK